MTKNEEIELNGEIYIKKSSIKQDNKDIDSWITKNKKGKTLCIVRTYSAGVFYGYVDYEKTNGFNAEIFEAVRIWKWEGAFTLSALATEGTSKSSGCRFGIEVPVIKVNRWIELIPVTNIAKESLNKVTRG